MDYPIHIDTISMELSILYFKGVVYAPVLLLHIAPTSKKLSILNFKGFLIIFFKTNAVFLSLKIILS